MGKSKAKKDREFWDMVNQCVVNSKKRSKDPKEHEAWRKEYYSKTKLEKPQLIMKVDNLKPCLKSGSPKYDTDELQTREQLAQQEIQRKQKQVAPAYSKGCYQFITCKEDLKSIYRK